MKLAKYSYTKLRSDGWTMIERYAYNENQLERSFFITKYISPLVEKSDSGWARVEYRIMKNIHGAKEEFLFYVRQSGELCYAICITADTKIAIIQDCFDNIY